MKTLRLDYSNPTSPTNEASLRDFFFNAETDRERVIALQEAINIGLLVLDCEAREILDNRSNTTDLYRWAFVYGVSKNWFSDEEWSVALSWDNPSLCRAALDTIGQLGLQLFAYRVNSLSGDGQSCESQEALARCQQALHDPSMVRLIYHPF